MQRQLASILRHLRRVVVQRTDGGLSDAQLLERFARQRDEAAFEVLVWRHGPMVLSVARRVLRNLHDAEDVLQATFLALVRQARSISRRESLGAWLHRVAYRTALRARTQREKRAAEPMEDAVARESLAEKPGSEALAFLDEELQRLAEKYRRPLVLSYLQGLTNREIAGELGCPIGTVFTRLARGREMLRLRLVRRGVTLSTAVFAAALAQAAPAALSAQLVKSTLQAAMTFAAGSAAAIAPHVAALTEGVLNMMWLSKLKLVAALLAMAVAAGTGAGLLVLHAAAREQDDGKKAVSDEKPQAEAKRPARESLRYGGKSFDEWHNTLLIDLKPEMRAEAIKALSTFGANGYAKEAATILVDTIRPYKRIGNLGDDQQIMNAAITGMRKIGAEAVPILVAEMKRGKNNVTVFAIHCLSHFSTEDAAPGLPAVIDALKIEDLNLRSETIITLRAIDPEAKSTRALAAVLSDKDPQIRGYALDALNTFGPKAKDATPELLNAATKDDRGENRALALSTLYDIKPSAEVILPTLKVALFDADSNVRWRAIECLSAQRSEGRTLVPELITAFKKSTNPTERMLIAHALGFIGPKAKTAVQVLTEALGSPIGRGDSDLNGAILQALEKINK